VKIIAAGRGAGKTYQLVQWALEDPNRIIVVSTHRQQRYLLDQYPRLRRWENRAASLDSSQVWTIADLEEKRHFGFRGYTLAFDEAQTILLSECRRLANNLEVDRLIVNSDEVMQSTVNYHTEYQTQLKRQRLETVREHIALLTEELQTLVNEIAVT
jgi:hypothetical protein